MKTANKPKKLKPEKNPAGMKLLRTLHGHADLVYGIAFSRMVKKLLRVLAIRPSKYGKLILGKKFLL